MGRCVFKALSSRDNHLCTVRFDTDKKRKRREILGHRKGVVGIDVIMML